MKRLTIILLLFSCACAYGHEPWNELPAKVEPWNEPPPKVEPKTEQPKPTLLTYSQAYALSLDTGRPMISWVGPLSLCPG